MWRERSLFMTGRTYKQLSREERLSTESDLNDPDIKLKTIAAHLNRDPKSIRYEVTHRAVVRVRSNQHNKCGLQDICTKVRLCPDCITGKCCECRHDNCNQICPDFNDHPVCSRSSRWPYVCNGCAKLSDCHLPKLFYFADKADIDHCHCVSDWKEGCQKSENDMAAIIRAFQKGIQNGLSVDVIIKEYGLNISTATAYRYIDAHLIPAVKNIDLKRKTRYSPRSSSKPKIIPKNPDFLNGRRLTDFNDRMERDPSVNVWQMDTVIGKKGSEEKCLLTLLYTRTNLQLYFLLDSKTSENVVKVFDKIKDFLGPDLFKETFTVIKTDNGTEFSEPLLIETDPQTGEQLINIYFCEPRRSDQKGKCEKNHEQLREIIPPGLSMYTLSTHDINYASNMINNYPRRLFHYKSPLELSVLFLNEKVLQLNRLTSLRLDQVKLTPILH